MQGASLEGESRKRNENVGKRDFFGALIRLSRLLGWPKRALARLPYPTSSLCCSHLQRTHLGDSNLPPAWAPLRVPCLADTEAAHGQTPTVSLTR